MRHLAAFAIALLGTACGYIAAGKWHDDPKNWDRAFHSIQPADVVVVHSEYWRNPHWSYEAGYLFAIEPNESLRQQLFTANKLVQLKPSEFGRYERPCFGDCPEWFAPGELEDYNVWRDSTAPNSRFRVFIHKKTGLMFLGDFQV